MTILTLFFFAAFGITSGFTEDKMRLDNIANGIKEPLNHGKLVERRLVVGFVFLFAVLVIKILLLQWSWTLIFLAPLAAGTFGIFHRLTINYAAGRGPWYLGIDSKIDCAALSAVGFPYIYTQSRDHFEAWSEILNYRKKVKHAAILLYSIEVVVAAGSAYIIL